MHICSLFVRNYIDTKWVVVGLFQSLVGALIIATAFILLVQSTKVIDMCLNFAALDFVQVFDDVRHEGLYRLVGKRGSYVIYSRFLCTI